MAVAARHKPLAPPSDADIKTELGPTWKQYQAAMKGLAKLELEPEFYCYGPSGGWTVRFQIANGTTGCALYLSRPPIGLVAVGKNTEAALQKDTKAAPRLVPLVSATPRRGKIRWVKVPLRDQAAVRSFLALAQTKVEAFTPPAKLSRTPHRESKTATRSRKTTDKAPRRSTARRSKRD